MYYEQIILRALDLRYGRLQYLRGHIHMHWLQILYFICNISAAIMIINWQLDKQHNIDMLD